MDQINTDDQLVAAMIQDIALDVLLHIGDDPEVRFQFFRQFIDLATRTVEQGSDTLH